MLGDLVAGGAYTATITFPARPVPGQERAHRIARSVLVPAGAIEQVVQAAGPIQAAASAIGQQFPATCGISIPRR
jgi:hypothetical protein